MASLHKKRRIEMKQLYDEYCQYVADPMSETKWFRMTMMKGKITLSEAKRNYDPKKVHKAKDEKKKTEKQEAKEVTKEEETKEAEKVDKKEEKEAEESEEKMAKKAEKEEKAEEPKKEVTKGEEKAKEKSDLEKAYEAESYNDLGKALKNKVEKVPASKDDRLKAAKEILEKGE